MYRVAKKKTGIQENLEFDNLGKKMEFQTIFTLKVTKFWLETKFLS